MLILLLAIVSHLYKCFRLTMTGDTPTTPVSGALKSVANTAVATSSPLRSKDVLLPLARVKTIMKSSPDVENIGQESLFLITKVH